MSKIKSKQIVAIMIAITSVLCICTAGYADTEEKTENKSATLTIIFDKGSGEDNETPISTFDKGSGEDAGEAVKSAQFATGFGNDVINESQDISSMQTESGGTYPGTEKPLTSEDVTFLLDQMNVPDFEAIASIASLYYSMDEKDIGTLLHLVEITCPDKKDVLSSDFYYQYLCASALINRYVLNSYPHHEVEAMIMDFYNNEEKYQESSVISTIMGTEISDSTYQSVLLALTHPFPGVYFCHNNTEQNNGGEQYQKTDEALYVSTIWDGWCIWSATAQWYS